MRPRRKLRELTVKAADGAEGRGDALVLAPPAERRLAPWQAEVSGARRSVGLWERVVARYFTGAKGEGVDKALC